jgi:class 3 adenylate cyclase
MGSLGVSAPPALSAAALAERRTAVLLYAELRNFTRMSEMLEAGRALGLLNEFFALTGRAMDAHGGEVFAFHNDAVLAAFRHGKPAQLAQHAVRAAQRLQSDFGNLAEAWTRGYGLHTAVAMGLHLGETVFGCAGPSGAERTLVFGDSVSVAERLVHRARAGEFVLSDAVMGALAASHLELGVEPLPALELPHRPAVRLFGVLLDTRLDFT